MITVDLQQASKHIKTPGLAQLTEWCDAAVPDKADKELTIRIIEKDEMQDLNARFRGKDQPTNVLSFPFEAPAGIALNLLGDVVICAPVVAEEARTQGKTEIAHWAHMVVHGILHLQGYDHETDGEAQEMEALEQEILKALGFPDPYKSEVNHTAHD